MSIAYNSDYSPPIPTLPITFGREGERAWLGPFEAILDTGADATIVPLSIAHRIKAVPLNPGQLESPWGDVHPVTLYIVGVEIAGQLLPGVVVAGDESADEIILGRDVLNKLPLFLDGPKERTEVLDDAAAKRLRARRE